MSDQGFDYRDVLLKAASRVEQEGMWCQDVQFLGGRDGFENEAAQRQLPACAVGSLRIATFELFGDDGGRLAFGDALSLTERVLGDGECLAYWNDEPGRTAAEVADLFRLAASA